MRGATRNVRRMVLRVSTTASVWSFVRNGSRLFCPLATPGGGGEACCCFLIGPAEACCFLIGPAEIYFVLWGRGERLR